MRQAPRPVIGWHVDGSPKLYALRRAAYLRIAREIFDAKYSVDVAASKRGQALYCEAMDRGEAWQRLATAVDSPPGSRVWYRQDVQAVNRALVRLAAFLEFVDSRRTYAEILAHMTAEERSREIQRLEAMAVEIMERVRAMERER